MKPGTFTQLYIHLIFAVKNRECLLHKDIGTRIFEYMSGILKQMKHKPIIVNGMPDHVHILLGLNPNISISDTIHGLKRSTSLLINNEKLFKGHFSWQEACLPAGRAMELFRIAVRNLIMFSIILKNRKNIIRKKHLKKNI